MQQLMVETPRNADHTSDAGAEKATTKSPGLFDQYGPPVAGGFYWQLGYLATLGGLVVLFAFSFAQLVPNFTAPQVAIAYELIRADQGLLWQGQLWA